MLVELLSHANVIRALPNLAEPVTQKSHRRICAHQRAHFGIRAVPDFYLYVAEIVTCKTDQKLDAYFNAQ